MNTQALRFSLSWEKSSDETDRLTTTALTIWVDGEPVWPVEGASQISLEIQADDLLSYLTEFWKPLMLRQTYPISVTPERPTLLRSEAEKRWEALPEEVVEREDEKVSAFEDAHDMSRCFAGIFDLPPIWLVRAGERMLVETRTALRSIAIEAAQGGLSEVGDEIADRLRRSGIDRWKDLIEAWNERDKGEPELLLAWSTSLDLEVASSLAKDGTLPAPRSVTDAANDNNELRIAARMASALPPEQIRQIVGLVRGFPMKSAPRLDELAHRVQAHVCSHFAKRRAHRQGEAAAIFAREALGFATVQVIDIFSLVESLGVAVHLENVEPQTLDGLAVWGSEHGPAVLLNKDSQRVAGRGDLRRNAAVRVTLAHELCHLLLDRAHVLTAVDVLNSRMPLDVERRCKAFAREFLLPGRVAADNWMQSGNPTSVVDLKKFLDKLGRKYRVPMSVAAWKLEHGLYRHDVDLRHQLDLAVPMR